MTAEPRAPGLPPPSNRAMRAAAIAAAVGEECIVFCMDQGAWVRGVRMIHERQKKCKEVCVLKTATVA